MWIQVPCSISNLLYMCTLCSINCRVHWTKLYLTNFSIILLRLDFPPLWHKYSRLVCVKIINISIRISFFLIKCLNMPLNSLDKIPQLNLTSSAPPKHIEKSVLCWASDRYTHKSITTDFSYKISGNIIFVNRTLIYNSMSILIHILRGFSLLNNYVV